MKILLLILSLLFLNCAAVISLDSTENDSTAAEIDAYIARVMDRYGIPGVSLAIIKDGELIHRANYGYANLEHQVPITDQSIFRVYSLTKIFVATGIFQLVEDGRLSIEDPISKYLDDLPTDWQPLEIQHLLAHASGLPDMSIFEYQDLSEEAAIAKIYQEALLTSPGQAYRYNQTNFWLLQRIIEQAANVSFEDFILAGQFEQPDAAVFFSSDSRQVIPNRTSIYFPFSTGERTIDVPYVGEYMHSANGLNISMDQFVDWDRRLANDELIQESTKSQMWTPFNYRQPRNFAIGWDIRAINDHISFGFSGSLVTAYRTFHEDDLSIIFLGTGMGEFFNIEVIMNNLAGLIDPNLIDQEAAIYEALTHAYSEGDLNEAANHFQTLKAAASQHGLDFEQLVRPTINFLRDAEKMPRALALAQTRIQEYPDSWAAYDQLALVQELMGDIEGAIANYRKTLTINPTYSHPQERLAQLLKN